MSKRSLVSLKWLLVLVTATAATAQRLPTGRFQPVRERAYDILHYKAEIDLDLSGRRLEAVATIDLEPLRTLDRLVFDAVELEIQEVRLIGAGTLPYAIRDNSLVIELQRQWRRGERLSVRIDYGCMPRAGMYFQEDPSNVDLMSVFTYGEGGLHANWLPIYGDVNDKFSTEMVVTVPEPYVAVSNGPLLSTTRGEKGKTVYHWLQKQPHSNYLLALYVGDLEQGQLEPAPGGIPQSFWVPRGRLEEGAVAFRNTVRMVEFFSGLLDYPYPWSKHDQVALPGFGSAMEHTGVTLHDISVLRREDAPLDFGGPTFSEYYTDWTAEATIAHELAHQWLGNLVTCRSLGHIWLNESFASYLMMLWAEESVGEDELLYALELARQHYFEYVADEHIIRPLEYHYFDDLNTIYNLPHTYLKGAAVLHMMRRRLGDELFFSGLAHYLRKHEFSNVVSGDLQSAMAKATGLNLERFFDDWVTGPGHPILEASSRYLEDRQLVDIEIRQVQPIVKGQDLFPLRLPITIATAEATWTETVWLEKEKEHVVLSAAEKPLMVSLDGAGDLVAEIRFQKELEELAYQARHDRLPGRLRALRQLAERFPVDEATLSVLGEVLSGKEFWALRAEAARLLGAVRTPAAEELIRRALEAEDYRVRKAAVLALKSIPAPAASALLERTVQTDPHSDVVGTAIVALARVDPDIESSFIEEQLQRTSWYDEIRIAGLQALEELARPEMIPTLRAYTQPPWNHEVRWAALRAWRASQSTDPELHAALMELAVVPSALLQPFAVEELGQLAIDAAAPLLEELIRWNGDANLTVLAREALEGIERVAAAEGLAAP